MAGISEARAGGRQLRVTIEALSSELRATEASLAHWRAHASRLHAKLRAYKHAPDNETMGAPRSLLPLASNISSRPREMSCSSAVTQLSFVSTSTFRGRREPTLPEEPTPFDLSWIRNAFTDPNEAEVNQRRDAAAAQVQAVWRGVRQRQHYAAARAFFAVVNGVVELTSGGKSVPAYTLTVVRGGHCWQVHHRFSDWLELDKQLAAVLPAHATRPNLPSRYPFRSSGLTAHRQYALNRYMTSVLTLTQPYSTARRTLLNFVSRSHMHWTYANDAVLLAPPTAARLEEARARQAQAQAQAMFYTASDPPMHRVPLARNGVHAASNGGHANGYEPTMNAGHQAVHDASTGATPAGAVFEPRQPPRGLLG